MKANKNWKARTPHEYLEHRRKKKSVSGAGCGFLWAFQSVSQ